MKPPKLLIVSGVASCAARARRLSEEAELCYAARILQQHGFKVRNLSGGFLLYPAVERFKYLLKSDR